MPPRLLVIVGPTASGKSTLAAHLGQLLPGEVIAADSVQVYGKFDIGSGKPTSEELSLCPHHLLGVRDAREPIDANQWVEMAETVIPEIHGRHSVPIICGGTFLWVRALLHGLAEAPPGDEEVRARHRAIAEREGRNALHTQLREVDEASAMRLHPNDFVRVSRALEVFELTGRPMSAFQNSHGFREQKHDAILIGIDWPREIHAQRVRRRARAMIDAGLRHEVAHLLEQGYGSTRAMNSVGYRQVRSALETGDDNDESLIDEITRVTRIFARRQRTWLRDQPIRWLSPEVLQNDLSPLAEELRRALWK